MRREITLLDQFRFLRFAGVRQIVRQHVPGQGPCRCQSLKLSNERDAREYVEADLTQALKPVMNAPESAALVLSGQTRAVHGPAAPAAGALDSWREAA